MRPARRQAALRQLDLFDRVPQEKAAADRWNDRRGENEALAKVFNPKNSTERQAGRYFFAVHDRGRFVGIASAPTRSAARASLLAGGVQ